MCSMSIGLVGGGLMALAISVFLGWVIMPNVVRTLVKQSAILQNGAFRYQVWQNTSQYVDVYLNVYVFNITNPVEVSKGGKPKLATMGPYTYLEKRGKKGINNMGNLVEYKETFHAFFRPEKSVGDDTKDIVTFINIPLVSIFKLATSLTESEFILGELNDMLEEKGEKLFRTETVRSMLFDGFSVQAFIELLSDPLVELAVGHVEAPKAFGDGKFAFYKGKNGSASDEYLIRTGKAAGKEFGEVVKWKNLTKLPWWSSPDCQHIRGTDGTLFAPYVNRNSKLETFVPELCRVISLTFSENRLYHGMPVMRFSTSKDDFLAPLRHKPNECYCTVKDLRLCNRTGVFSLAPCRDGAPISASLPHFLDADQQLIEDLDGVDPQDDLHRSYFDIEPISGVLVAAAKRLQFNVEVKRHPSIPMVSKVRCLTIPIFWAEEVTAIPEKLNKQVLRFYYTQGKIETARWSMVGASIVCILLGLIWVISSKRDELQTAEQWKE